MHKVVPKRSANLQCILIRTHTHKVSANWAIKEARTWKRLFPGYRHAREGPGGVSSSQKRCFGATPGKFTWAFECDKFVQLHYLPVLILAFGGLLSRWLREQYIVFLATGFYALMPESFISLIKMDLDRYFFWMEDGAKKTSGRLRFISAVIEHLIYMDGYRALFFYRLQHSSPIKKNRPLRVLIRLLNAFLNRIELDPRAQIGAGCMIPHGQCIIIGSSCILGKNVTIYQGVTIGAIAGKMKNGRVDPVIGDGVMLGAGAKVLGPICIGNNSVIGANSVVIHDIPENSVAVGIPAKVVRRVSVPFPVTLEGTEEVSGSAP